MKWSKIKKQLKDVFSIVPDDFEARAIIDTIKYFELGRDIRRELRKKKPENLPYPDVGIPDHIREGWAYRPKRDFTFDSILIKTIMETKIPTTWDLLVEAMKSDNLDYKIEIWDDLRLKDGEQTQEWMKIYGDNPTTEQRAQINAVVYWSIKMTDVRDKFMKNILHGKPMDVQKMYLQKCYEIAPPGKKIRFMLVSENYKDWSVMRINPMTKSECFTPGNDQVSEYSSRTEKEAGAAGFFREYKVNNCSLSIIKMKNLNKTIKIRAFRADDTINLYLSHDEVVEIMTYLLSILK